MVAEPAEGSAEHTVTAYDVTTVIQGMMQCTSDGFRRIEGRMDSIDARLEKIEADSQVLRSKLLHHDLHFKELRRIAQDLTDKHSAYINDIADLVDRVTRLEKQMPHVSDEELYELQHMLQRLVDWAMETAKTVKIPLELP